MVAPDAEKGDAKSADKKKTEKENEISEEDLKLQAELNMLVERLQEGKLELQKPALEALRNQIRSSTTSMTSVPKPLKFLRPHFDTIKNLFEKISDPDVKKICASVLSVMSMTMSSTRESIKYKMLATKEDIGAWGHEYVRHLAGEVTQEWNETAKLDESQKTVYLQLAQEIVRYFMDHNAEPEACDLLMEIEQLKLLETFVDTHSYNKVCLYLVSCVPYVADPEDTQLLKTAIKLYHKFNQYTEAIRLAIRLNDMTLIKELFLLCPDRATKKQIAFILAHSQVYLELDENSEGYDELMEIMSNSQLNANHLALARELDIAEPKTPEDVYKTHLEQHRSFVTGTGLDSARQNLASAFVNGLVNCAFGTDKMFAEDGNKWIYKNKEHGMLSATASLGLILLWDVDGGLTQIDKYLYATDEYIKSGALLACGIVNARIRNDCDPAKALLSEHITNKSGVIRTGAVIGMSLAYAGTNRADVIEVLLPALEDDSSTLEIKCFTAVSLGLVAVGTCNAQIAEAILQTMMERTALELKDPLAKMLALGLGLLHLGQQERVDTVRATLQVLDDPYKTLALHFVDACAYAGTGNVLKIQQFLHSCSEHVDKKDEEEKKNGDKKEEAKDDKDKKKEEAADAGMHQAVAALGIALIAMGEDIGSEMSLRSFGHLLRYGDAALRRAVPLALGLLSVSNPKLTVMDTLSKFSHDNDSEVASNSVLAMGLIGAGTNNARLATMLRNLAVYHTKDANSLFMVRIAQGLLHMGKGTHTLSPQYSDRFLVSRAALAGLLVVLTACLDVKSTILGKHHYLLYYLVPAIQSRMLVCFDEDLKPVTTTVRVGTAVDIVGQAGRPKAITGFQTHTTPVLMNYGERAELATDDYVPLTSVLEGFVVLRKRSTDQDMT
ncbi:26S proteasome non-ATPase regulatory subunit 2-like [Paramacrobiotus metropolitanus]|uniref:26S proteasome non-ATPase regulatory subunit 2-like n=1 Tax=Paramacrobiotus metropolitanus TaxID=2943436 RepID=UPI002445D13E|nr:26S proteasome non-ATPase regulatory subunit 2-like [Paramacrobiotus metropolitanus]XP_055338383.1 26S proteasome non-ATPase regulatory subunit 2-like [Paramacrobiotus metropolitanus]